MGGRSRWGSRSLEALYFAVIGQGSKTREEGEKRAPCGGVPATTVATATVEPGPNQGHQEGGQVLLRADKEEAPGEGALSDPPVCFHWGGYLGSAEIPVLNTIQV